METFKIFDALEVPLEESNLIEASAGTGKTYSIAIGVLRLVVEKELPLKEILMVTFTKAAVAELETRIRDFVRLAAAAARGTEVADEAITRVVSRAVAAKGAPRVTELLTAAVLLLDETSVMTIHSFCQQTLSEFALETGQLFGSETLDDVQALIDAEVNKFWRTRVTAIPTGLLGVLCDNGLTRKNLSEVLSAYFSEKRYLDYEPSQDYRVEPNWLAEQWDGILPLLERAETLTSEMCREITGERGWVRAATQSNHHAKKTFGPLHDHPEKFIEKLVERRETAYVQKLYDPLLTTLTELDEVTAAIRERSREVISRLFCLQIRAGAENLEAFKDRNGVLSFDDMITRLHAAVLGPGAERLISGLRGKYKAVFIDEFQDTDKKQYEIFSTAFGDESLLFYIGDPKQSIYGWRKADISTYLKARGEVAARYSMNVNYRSSGAFIASMNRFFLPAPDFDTFAFAGEADGFGYTPVDAPAKQIPGLRHDGTEVVPLKILYGQRKDEILETLSRGVLDLLEDRRWQVPGREGYRPLEPSDIGILVRTNQEGADVKRALGRKGIPAISIDDQKILATEEAMGVLYLLEAMHEPGRGPVNKALLGPLTGFDREYLAGRDTEALTEQFRRYGALWSEKGVYVALHAFLGDYDVYATLLHDTEGLGERRLANMVQLIEVVHRTQVRRGLNEAELIGWLQKGTEGSTQQGDEFEQRIESDEKAVRIVTIHKSKGLEYGVVFAPFLDFIERPRKPAFQSFRDENHEYVLVESDRLTASQQALLSRQLEQENRRLIYVAVTRAVYACFVYHNTGSRYKNSSLVPFISALRDPGPAAEGVALMDAQEVPSHPRYSGKPRWQPATALPVPTTALRDSYWRRLSYTFLAKKHPYVMKDDSHELPDRYDHFVFKELARGNVTGNMLHQVLEKIDFASQEHWDRHVGAAIKRYMPGVQETYPVMLARLLEEVVTAPIAVGGEVFSLSGVRRQDRISELEFDFPTGEFRNTDIAVLSTPGRVIDVNDERRLSGMMNGKIDLVFRYEGRYYILDWKSNFLGDELGYYSAELLGEAMNEANYHLQYLLYTLALKRYLTLRLPGFDYERHFGGVIYIFLRGIRTSGGAGVFTARPSLEDISLLERLLNADGKTVA
jgi:exodeoxyribonuclease V beta subunit